METFKNYGPGNKVWSIELNTIQEQIPGIISSSSASNELLAMPDGAMGFTWQYSSPLADNALLTVISNTITVSDGAGSTTTTTISWMDRFVILGKIRLFSAADTRPGGANDYLYASSGANYDFEGYTGLGALDGGGNPVTAPANPPVPAAGTSWAIEPTTGLWIYVDPSDDAIKLYNDTGAAILAPQIRLILSAPTGKRP